MRRALSSERANKRKVVFELYHLFMNRARRFFPVLAKSALSAHLNALTRRLGKMGKVRNN